MQPGPMRLEKRPLADLVEYEANAKKHGPGDVQKIMESIERFGFNDPIAVDENNEIIEGHGRKEAAVQLGFDEVPVLVLDGLTDRQKRLYRVAHNKIALASTFDFERLTDTLRDMQGQDISFGQLGFDDKAARTLMEVVFSDDGEDATRETIEGTGQASDAEQRPDDYEVVWDDDEQRKRWRAFERKLTNVYPNMTIAEARSRFLQDVGIVAVTERSEEEADRDQFI